MDVDVDCSGIGLKRGKLVAALAGCVVLVLPADAGLAAAPDNDRVEADDNADDGRDSDRDCDCDCVCDCDNDDAPAAPPNGADTDADADADAAITAVDGDGDSGGDPSSAYSSATAPLPSSACAMTCMQKKQHLRPSCRSVEGGRRVAGWGRERWVGVPIPVAMAVCKRGEAKEEMEREGEAVSG